MRMWIDFSEGRGNKKFIHLPVECCPPPKKVWHFAFFLPIEWEVWNFCGEIWTVEGKETKLDFVTQKRIILYKKKKLRNTAFLETVQFTVWRQIAEQYL